MMEPGESIEDYVERRVSEALDAYRVTDIQHLPLAALRRWSEANYQEFENDSPLETRLPLLTALPQAPQDGQVIAYDAGDGITWRFRYNAGSTSSYKWEFVGGPALRDQKDGGHLQSVTTANTWQDFDAGAAPTITLPLAGDYDFAFGAGRWQSQSGAPFYMAAWNAANTVQTRQGATTLAANQGVPGAMTARPPGVAAGAWRLRHYHGTAGVNHIYVEDRWLQATPIRVG